MQGFRILHSLLFRTPRRHVDVLQDLTAYLMPGTMTLILGPRGSGKSSVHKLVSGRAPVGSGRVLFNGKPRSAVKVHRLAGVGFQEDRHLGGLSVRETLEFARYRKRVRRRM